MRRLYRHSDESRRAYQEGILPIDHERPNTRQSWRLTWAHGTVGIDAGTHVPECVAQDRAGWLTTDVMPRAMTLLVRRIRTMPVKLIEPLEVGLTVVGLGRRRRHIVTTRPNVLKDELEHTIALCSHSGWGSTAAQEMMTPFTIRLTTPEAGRTTVGQLSAQQMA
jgi:hypothetical protein